jgi:release factor glutamine methyltransferase
LNLSKALRRATLVLEEAGVESARVDAELLAAYVIGVPRDKLLLVSTLDDEARYDELIAQRARRIPLQHLTGQAPFLGLTLKVGPGVFIPRPETELLAQWAIERRPATAVDLCSGTGAIALALKHGCPQATVYAVESSPEALPWLRLNGSGQIAIIEGDIRTVEIPAPVDLVVCNPPYVPAAAPVAEEVRHDPPAAVFGGADGLELIPAVIARAAALLKPGGWFGLEHDESHALTGLLTADFEDITPMDDLAGRPRFVTARRSADADFSRRGSAV